MEYYDGFLGASKKIQRTKIVPLRWIGNGLGSISTEFLLKAVYLEEGGKAGIRTYIYSKLWIMFNYPYEKWGTYYTLNMQKWKESMSGTGWDDYQDGIPYWDYHWHEDPLTGDAWRLKKKDIFETQVDFE